MPYKVFVTMCLLTVIDLVTMAPKVRQHKLMTSEDPEHDHHCPFPCICQEREAFCDGSDIGQIPIGLPEGLTKVNLMDNRLRTVKKKHLVHLRNLKSLNLRGNHIDHIEDGAFETLALLKALTLRENRLRKLNSATFRGLKQLELLSLRANQLGTVEGAFQDLANIRLLSLGDNDIAQVTHHMFSNNQRLEYLDLHNNSISTIDRRAFSHLHMLKYLVLRDNPINSAELNFRSNFHLELLDLTNCKLQEMVQGLPSSIRDLRVGENNITSLSQVDFKMIRKIRLLVVNDNNLARIHNHTFSKLQFLDELEISNNSLRSIPLGLPASLRKATYANNSITHIKRDDFKSNWNLEHLSLKLNKIAQIDMDSFIDLINLKTLDLSRNQISLLQPATFESCRKLELLDLSHNPITSVEHNCFLGLGNLHILEMGSVQAGEGFQPGIFKDINRLLYLDLSNSTNIARRFAKDPNLLHYIKSVQDLNLMYNSLYYLPESFAKSLPNLKSLKLIGNPWHCDKSIYWMTNWLKNNSVDFFEADSILCASPPELRGRRVDSLTLRELPIPSPIINFIPEIEIIEINFHHNETFSAYRDNKDLSKDQKGKQNNVSKTSEFPPKSNYHQNKPTDAIVATKHSGQSRKKQKKGKPTMPTLFQTPPTPIGNTHSVTAVTLGGITDIGNTNTLSNQQSTDSQNTLIPKLQSQGRTTTSMTMMTLKTTYSHLSSTEMTIGLSTSIANTERQDESSTVTKDTQSQDGSKTKSIKQSGTPPLEVTSTLNSYSSRSSKDSGYKIQQTLEQSTTQATTFTQTQSVSNRSSKLTGMQSVLRSSLRTTQQSQKITSTPEWTLDHTTNTPIQPYEIKHHKPDVRKYNNTRKVFDIHRKGVESTDDNNEPTIARITVKRFTKAPPQIYWATKATQFSTERPKEEKNKSEFPTNIQRNTGKENEDKPKRQSLESTKVRINDHSRPFNERKLSDLNHQLGNREVESKVQENKPFQGTQLWWSHSEGGPFSSLNSERFANVRQPVEKQSKNNENPIIGGYIPPWHSKSHDITRGDSRAVLSQARTNNGDSWWIAHKKKTANVHSSEKFHEEVNEQSSGEDES